MRKLLIILVLLISSSVLVACSTAKDLNNQMLNAADNLPGVYKINVRQGNLVTQEMIDQLRPGMDKRQVTFILGTPLLVDPFHKNRWDYFYDLKLAGKQNTKERVTVIFDDDRLISLKGDFKPSNEFKPMTVNTEVIDVPKREEKEKSIMDRVLRSLGIEYDEKL